MHIIYTTTETEDEAKKIAQTLVERKLVACANIMPGMQSVYQWEGKVEQSQEVVVILKTLDAMVDEVFGVIKSLHSYDCPAIFSWATDKVDDNYIKWLENSIELPY